MRHVIAWILLILLASPVLAQTDEKVYYDQVDERGRLQGGFTRLPRPVESKSPTRDVAPCTTLIANGAVENRIDLVMVGDGYTAASLATYAAQVDEGLLGFFTEEPFHTYQTFFNVHRVDVVSNEEGVDNDPSPGVLRDTALGMGFWCSGIERLLCIDLNAAFDYALNAPDRDQMLALANSVKYGGAGYTDSDLATVSGGNDDALDVAIHEFGHSIGNLADEYDYADGTTYFGPEPVERNISTLTAGAMGTAGTKWAPWLGFSHPDADGLVDTYEGAGYYVYGLYRPTNNSMMRSLGRPFNLPSMESLVIEMYQTVRPVDGSTPTGTVLAGNETVFVDPVDPVGQPLSIQWSLDGVPLTGATGETLDLGSLQLAIGLYSLSVTVTDNTPFVRDETARAQWMSETLTWSLDVLAVADAAAPVAGLAPTNHPNPFNPRTVISFHLPHDSSVGLRVYDTSGRLVRILATTGHWLAGQHEVVWDGRDDGGRELGSGIYLYRLEAGLLRETRKMVLLR